MCVYVCIYIYIHTHTYFCVTTQILPCLKEFCDSSYLKKQPGLAPYRFRHQYLRILLKNKGLCSQNCYTGVFGDYCRSLDPKPYL